jgi:hypothetical protein
MKTTFALTGCLVAAMTALPAAAPAAGVPAGEPDRTPNTEVLSLLKYVHAKALDAGSRSGELQTLVRSPNVSWQSDIVTLGLLRDDINDMGRAIARLEQLRSSAAASDRKAIDEAAVWLAKMARNTKAALEFANANQNDLWMPAFQKYANLLANESEALYGSVGKFVRLDQVRAREHHLDTVLGVEAGS